MNSLYLSKRFNALSGIWITDIVADHNEPKSFKQLCFLLWDKEDKMERLAFINNNESSCMGILGDLHEVIQKKDVPKDVWKIEQTLHWSETKIVFLFVADYIHNLDNKDYRTNWVDLNKKIILDNNDKERMDYILTFLTK